VVTTAHPKAKDEFKICDVHGSHLPAEPLNPEMNALRSSHAAKYSLKSGHHQGKNHA
jgi:hypothetical protein